jgi:hypothetical protein
MKIAIIIFVILATNLFSQFDAQELARIEGFYPPQEHRNI